MARKKVTPVVPKVPLVHLSLKLGNELYESSGATVLEALLALPKPPKIFLKGIFTISQGDKCKEFVMQPVKIKRLFYKIARLAVAKSLSYFLK